jgi:hypothetical protein
MREAVIERKFSEMLNVNGHLSLKFNSPGWPGAPDRLIILKTGDVFFVEFKAPGKVLRALQRKRVQQLEDRNVPVFVVDSMEGAKVLLRAIEEGTWRAF